MWTFGHFSIRTAGIRNGCESNSHNNRCYGNYLRVKRIFGSFSACMNGYIGTDDNFLQMYMVISG